MLRKILPPPGSYYRSALFGTFLVAITLFLIIGLTVEISFGQYYYGDGTDLPTLGIKLGISISFLAFLIIRDQTTLPTLEKVRRIFLIALLAICSSVWLVGYTNRAFRGPRHHYTEIVTLVGLTAHYTTLFGKAGINTDTPPDYIEAEVLTAAGKKYTFRTNRPIYTPEMRGKAVVLPLVRGRWGQDYIAYRE